MKERKVSQPRVRVKVHETPVLPAHVEVYFDRLNRAIDLPSIDPSFERQEKALATYESIIWNGAHMREDELRAVEAELIEIHGEEKARAIMDVAIMDLMLGNV